MPIAAFNAARMRRTDSAGVDGSAWRVASALRERRYSSDCWEV